MRLFRNAFQCLGLTIIISVVFLLLIILSCRASRAARLARFYRIPNQLARITPTNQIRKLNPNTISSFSLSILFYPFIYQFLFDPVSRKAHEKIPF